MIELIAHNLAPIMFFSMVLFLLFGYPIAFALAANGLLFYVIGVELTPYANGQINLSWNLLSALPERLWGIMKNDIFLAIPFFTFMGIVLEKSGMAEDLLDTIGQLFGPVRGGLAYAVVIVGALLAATTGVVAASVMAMGLISLPIMLRYRYDRGIATGVIAASGTLAQIVPPSLVLIVLADQLGRSVGDMYKGALYPALLLTGFYLFYIFVVSLLRPDAMPALPKEARNLGKGVTSLIIALAIAVLVFFGMRYWMRADGVLNAGIWSAVIAAAVMFTLAMLNNWLRLNLLSHLAQRVIFVLIPPLSLIFLVLGTIFLGIATPTEGGAMGAVGALLLAIIKRRLTYSVMRQALVGTTRLSSFVMFILIGATVFSLTFYAINGQIWVKDLLIALPGGQLGFLLAVSLLIFILGFFLDFFEIAFVIVPLLVPAVNHLGIDMIWFGVILAMVLQTSFLTPPVGFALFYLRSITARKPYTDSVTGEVIEPVTTVQIYRGAVKFVGLQLVMLGIVISFPGLVTHYKEQPVRAATERVQIPSFGGSSGQGGQSGLGGLGGSPFGAPSGETSSGGGLGGGLGNGLGGSPFGAPSSDQGSATEAPAGSSGGLGGGLGNALPGTPNFGGSPSQPAETAPAAPEPAPEPAAPAAPSSGGGMGSGLGGPPPGLGGN
ncbi:TRAP transporter large permease [Paracoccus tegillarcae]|uniref:C4-dicarboxylate ABC transporter n=1 Tax=Paracoccus tegillarcae TaxID=1529068 RepID=A0A2K9EK55_9RHOB|nr:TRAP transporter large permease subunit [Paracoccus tegillarcae]AUH34779.1 C4-dicarboxylate ABC transporter [Paracoccus tegillarcae]